MKRYVFMYNNFGDEIEDQMYTYLKEFYGDDVLIHNHTLYNGNVDHHGTSIWVAEDKYRYVFATINAWNLYNQDEYDVVTIADCEEWMKNHKEKGLVLY